MSEKSKLTRFLPFIILFIVVIAITCLILFKPQAKRGKPPTTSTITVATQTLKRMPFTVRVESYGRIEATIRTELRAQVGGKIVSISDTFNDGGFIKKGDVLISIEKDDYLIALTQAQATHLDAKRMLEEEEARAAQAKQNWKSLGKTGEPAPLVLRKPQIDAAKARLKSAEATLAGAQLNLDRTDIRAPYDGRVVRRNVNLFQIVNNNTVLGDIFSTESMEVKLPIKGPELNLISLPRNLQDSQPTDVTILTTTQTPQSWPAKLVRASGNIDEQTRQSFVVAKINKPYSQKHKDKTPLKVGQYVKAFIEGKTLDNALVIDNKAIYQGSYVYLYRDGKIYRQNIAIQWQNEKHALISNGLNPNDSIVISPLGQVTSGTSVRHEQDIKNKNNTRRDNKKNKNHVEKQL